MQAPDVPTGSHRRVLVVEDEVMIRMLLDDMLDDLGFKVALSAGRLDEAMAHARDGDFDLAILDVNLNGDLVYPVADLLAARGLPFVFSSGYGDSGIPEPYRNRPTLQKPFQLDGLESALKKLLPPVGAA